MNQHGYIEMSKIAFFGLALGEATYKSLEEAATPTEKAIAFFSCADEAIDLLSIDRVALANEWSDFSVEERADLLADCAERFDIADDALEARVERAIGAAFKVLDGIQGAFDIWKEVRQ